MLIRNNYCKFIIFSYQKTSIIVLSIIVLLLIRTLNVFCYMTENRVSDIKNWVEETFSLDYDL